MRLPKNIDKEKLYQLYSVEGKSMKECATIFKVCKSTIANYLKKYQISSHPPYRQKMKGIGSKFEDHTGYYRVYYPTHPNCYPGGCVKEHRVIMEKHLGRYLTDDEVVHHINGNRKDNRIENLQVMTRSEHAKLHQQLLKEQRNGEKES